MKKSNLIIIAVATACAVPTAFAQQEANSEYASNGSGVYASASAGQFMFSCGDAENIIRSSLNLRCDDEKSLAVRVNGGFRWNYYLAVEVGYSATGEMEMVASGNTTVDRTVGDTTMSVPVANANVPLDIAFSALDLSMLLSYPLDEFFSVYGRAGMSFWESKVGGGIGQATVGGVANQNIDLRPQGWQDESGEDILYGAGVQFHMNNNVNAYLDWTRVDVSYEETHITTDTVMLGATYRF